MGNGLTLNGGGITLGGSALINLPITLGARQSWTITGPVSGIPALTVNGVISGADSAGLTKDGIGTLRLDGNNTYTGITTVASGTLEVNGSQPGSNVIVSGGANLTGSGTVGAITTSGAISPGVAEVFPPGGGILHSGNVTFNAGSFLNVSPGLTGVSQLNVTGTVNLSGNPKLTVTLLFGGTFTAITSTGAIIGTFDGLPDNSRLTVPVGDKSETFRINYQTHSVVLTALPPNRDYVTQLYFDLLRRQPDAGGLTFWTDLLDQNQATRSQVALAFVNSPEYRMQE